MIRVRLPSPIPMACSPTGECRLVFAMHLLHFKGVSWRSFQPDQEYHGSIHG
jgi:hypothetical protein